MMQNYGRLTLDDIYAMYEPMLEQFLRVVKATGAITTADAQYINAFFGWQIWSQISQEANALGILPKHGWSRSGIRVKTGLSHSSFTYGAIDEGGLIPAPIKPDLYEVQYSVKQYVYPFEVSDIYSVLGQFTIDDVLRNGAERIMVGADFLKAVNQMILRKPTENESGATESKLFQTLDRIAGATTENTPPAGTEYTHIYGINRSANAWAQGIVEDLGGGALTINNIIKLRQSMLASGGNPTVWLTGPNTYTAILGLFVNITRYVRPEQLGMSKVTFGVEGISTSAGIDAGFDVASILGVPLIQSVDVIPNYGV